MRNTSAAVEEMHAFHCCAMENTNCVRRTDFVYTFSYFVTSTVGQAGHIYHKLNKIINLWIMNKTTVDTSASVAHFHHHRIQKSFSQQNFRSASFALKFIGKLPVPMCLMLPSTVVWIFERTTHQPNQAKPQRIVQRCTYPVCWMQSIWVPFLKFAFTNSFGR